MSSKSLALLACLFLLVSQASSARVRKLSENSTEVSAEAAFQCRDLCVACGDGSTVFFGRNSNWWKVVPTVTLGAIGAAAASTGVGLVGVAVAGAAGAAVGVGAGDKAAKETHTHWAGNLPTSGAFCERVDVIKRGLNQQPQVLMSAADTKLGRVQNNNLKPYDAHKQPRQDNGISYQPGDEEAYKQGCKIVKAAGLYGSWSQFKSNFQSECESKVAQGTMTCATHSQLCGMAGVHGILETNDYTSCMDAASLEGRVHQMPPKCPKMY